MIPVTVDIWFQWFTGFCLCPVSVQPFSFDGFKYIFPKVLAVPWYIRRNQLKTDCVPYFWSGEVLSCKRLLSFVLPLWFPFPNNPRRNWGYSSWGLVSSAFCRKKFFLLWSYRGKTRTVRWWSPFVNAKPYHEFFCCRNKPCNIETGHVILIQVFFCVSWQDYLCGLLYHFLSRK